MATTVDPDSTSATDADGTSTGTTTGAAGCGNGELEDDEVCDDGVNDGSYAGCLPGCGALGPRCGDEVLQPVEACDDGNRADADGCNVNCVVSGSEIWTEVFDAAGNYPRSANAVAIGLSDDVLVAGSEATAGDTEAWIGRLDADGNAIWVESYASNGAAETIPRGIGVDEVGHVYVGGLAQTGGPGGFDGWLRAYDEDAGLLFSHDPGIEVFGVAVSADGNAAFVGSAANFGIIARIRTRRLAADGDPLWTEDIDDPPLDLPGAEGIAVDLEENIVVVANLFRNNAADGQLWARKYNSNGTVLWTRAIDTDNSNANAVSAVSTGPNNEVAIVGTLDGDLWVMLYDQDGQEQWTTTDAAGSNGSGFLAVAIDEAGSVVAAGADGATGVVRKRSSIGAELWTQEFDDFVPEGVAVDSQSSIVIVGDDDNDGWVRKLAP